MSICQCDACARRLGLSPGPTFSESFRLAREARLVLSWPENWRARYLELVLQHRGASGRDSLAAALAAAQSESGA